jgi:hypothetical protein
MNRIKFALPLLSIVMLVAIGCCALPLAHRAGLPDGVSRLVNASVNVLAIGSIVAIVVAILARRDA